MKKAFIVVGHSNWGKSKTLYELTGSHHSYKVLGMENKSFRIKRMSNDDIDMKLLEYVKSIPKEDQRDAILTLCPDFEDKHKCTNDILEELRYNYELYFFVLRKKYKKDNFITEQQISMLKKYGIVNVYESKEEEASSKSVALKSFIISNIDTN